MHFFTETRCSLWVVHKCTAFCMSGMLMWGCTLVTIISPEYSKQLFSCSPRPPSATLTSVWYKTSSFSVLCKEPWRHRFKKSCYILPNTLIRQSLQGSYLLILKLPLTTVHDCFTLFLRMICRICPSGMLCNNCYS